MIGSPRSSKSESRKPRWCPREERARCPGKLGQRRRNRGAASLALGPAPDNDRSRPSRSRSVALVRVGLKPAGQPRHDEQNCHDDRAAQNAQTNHAPDGQNAIFRLKSARASQ